MTLTKKQQSNNKALPNELLFEIFKSIKGYPNLVIKNQKINETTKQQSFVWKIKVSENVLISSQIIHFLCGETFKKILMILIMSKSHKRKFESVDNEITKEEEAIEKLKEQKNLKLTKLEEELISMDLEKNKASTKLTKIEENKQKAMTKFEEDEKKTGVKIKKIQEDIDLVNKEKLKIEQEYSKKVEERKSKLLALRQSGECFKNKGVEITGEQDVMGDSCDLSTSPLKKKARHSIEDILQKKEKVFVTRGDITKLAVDVIVNSANSALLDEGGKLNSAIHAAAGPELMTECKQLNGCKIGEAKMTKAYNINVKAIIHTVGPGPIILEVGDLERQLIRSCYKKAMDLTQENGLRSIAFPCISTGIHKFPKEEACQIALQTINTWFKGNEDSTIEKVILCVFNEKDEEIYKRKIPEIIEK